MVWSSLSKNREPEAASKSRVKSLAFSARADTRDLSEEVKSDIVARSHSPSSRRLAPSQCLAWEIRRTVDGVSSDRRDVCRPQNCSTSITTNNSVTVSIIHGSHLGQTWKWSCSWHNRISTAELMKYVCVSKISHLSLIFRISRRKSEGNIDTLGLILLRSRI